MLAYVIVARARGLKLSPSAACMISMWYWVNICPIISGYNAAMTFYTSKGDDGTTGLLGEGRVMKYHARIEAVGTLDESTAALGLARAQCVDPHSGGILLEAQRDLYKLMAEVAATPDNAERFHFI